jgi:hypothetical protein
MVEGIVMNLVVGTEGFDFLALAAPFVVIALPCMVLIAAFAILFESFNWLRGDLGNVIYFFSLCLRSLQLLQRQRMAFLGNRLIPTLIFPVDKLLAIASRAPRIYYPGAQNKDE